MERARVSLHCAQKTAQSAILNLEQGDTVTRWGRLVFHVTNVDALWTHLNERGFDPEIPQDASWGERYFHMPDPDGHHCRLLVRYNDARELRWHSALSLPGEAFGCWVNNRKDTLYGRALRSPKLRPQGNPPRQSCRSSVE